MNNTAIDQHMQKKYIRRLANRLMLKDAKTYFVLLLILGYCSLTVISVLWRDWLDVVLFATSALFCTAILWTLRHSHELKIKQEVAELTTKHYRRIIEHLKQRQN